jgi:aryl-alcohol dehydrogenase-like predicted oxidoreductase
MARLVAGVAAGRDFAEPVEVTGAAHLGETGVDEYALAVMRFEGDVLAELATGVRLQQDNSVRIFGTEGVIHVPTPWIPSREGGTTKIIVRRHEDKEPREIEIAEARWLYSIEADTVARNLDARQAPPPAMSWEDTLGNMRALDMWREGVGLVYESEKPENVTCTASRGPLAVREGTTMKYGKIPGVELPVSRLGMGIDNQTGMPHTAVMLDDFFERGGNCFDTAYIYGGGVSEKLLGGWIANRGIRRDVVIIDKGGHSPNCVPDALSRHVMEGLERLQTDYIDIYLLHRDNPDVPVGEFVDVFNEHVAAGRIRAFGGSNWTPERVEAANAYAKEKGVTGFAVVSNNFSLARMVQAVWGGCISSSDKASRDWHERTGIALIPWSSQARGFFVEGRAHPDDRSDPGLVRSWYSDDNFRRLERAKELARKKNVLPINIALAYVLCQPFPTFPLIGPRKLSETRTSWPALEVELTPDELRWLNLEE